MKRYKLSFLFAILFLLVFTGCYPKDDNIFAEYSLLEEDAENPYNITLSKENITVNANGCEEYVNIITNAPQLRLYIDDQSWVRAHIVDDELSIDIFGNPTTQTRTQSIDITSGITHKYLTVTQSANSKIPIIQLESVTCTNGEFVLKIRYDFGDCPIGNYGFICKGEKYSFQTDNSKLNKELRLSTGSYVIGEEVTFRLFAITQDGHEYYSNTMSCVFKR